MVFFVFAGFYPVGEKGCFFLRGYGCEEFACVYVGEGFCEVCFGLVEPVLDVAHGVAFA